MALSPFVFFFSFLVLSVVILCFIPFIMSSYVPLFSSSMYLIGFSLFLSNRIYILILDLKKGKDISLNVLDSD